MQISFEHVKDVFIHLCNVYTWFDHYRGEQIRNIMHDSLKVCILIHFIINLFKCKVTWIYDSIKEKVNYDKNIILRVYNLCIMCGVVASRCVSLVDIVLLLKLVSADVLYIMQ